MKTVVVRNIKRTDAGLVKRMGALLSVVIDRRDILAEQRRAD